MNIDPCVPPAFVPYVQHGWDLRQMSTSTVWMDVERKWFRHAPEDVKARYKEALKNGNLFRARLSTATYGFGTSAADAAAQAVVNYMNRNGNAS